MASGIREFESKAAVSAADAGASMLVLEKGPGWAGAPPARSAR
ncbi:hypothetical protein [Microbacterium sp. E-13]